MNSIFNCFHAGISLLSCCFGVTTPLPTTMDHPRCQGNTPLPGLNNTTPASLLVQEYGLQEKKHEGKHDSQHALPILDKQSCMPNTINETPPYTCPEPHNSTTCSHKHATSVVSIHTLIPPAQDLLHQYEHVPVAQRTRSKLTTNVLPCSSSNHKDYPRPVYPFQRRATQRWCKLLTATESRLAKNELKDALGSHWSAFVNHAKDHYWPKWKHLFSSAMTCNGPLRDGCCPFQLSVDPTCKQNLGLMHLLHLDHAYPLHSICRGYESSSPKQLL